MRKRLIAILLCISTMLSLCTGFASAASSTIGGALGEVNITNGGYKMSYLSMNGVVRSQSYTYFNFKSASGAIKEIPAYCINPTTKGVPQSVNPGESIKYIANEASSDPKIMGIIANGYPHKGLSELKLDNKQQAYYATKMALWCYLIDDWSIDRLTLNPSLSGAEKERGEKILAAAKNIYKNGIWWNRVPQPTITVTADKDSAYPVTVDGKEYLQQVFTADSETWVCDYDIDIAFTMPDEVPEGTRIVDMNNNDITKIRTSSNGASYAGQFKVLYPKDSVSDQTGAVQMSLHANVYKYAIYYALCAETSKYGTLQRYMCDTAPTTEIRQSTFSRYSAAPSDTPDKPETPTETTLIINKVETGTNTPLSGATFEVKAPDGTVLGSFVTDASGKIIVPLTLSGQYVITEKAAPKWHLLGAETTRTVSVDYGNTATVTFENAPYGNLRVDKIDADSGASLAGATVEIRHIESGVTQTGTTDLGGSVYFDKLKPGAYQVREASAPSGYVKDGQTYTVNVTSGTETSFVLKNQAKPGLIITKYDDIDLTSIPASQIKYTVQDNAGTVTNIVLGDVTGESWIYGIGYGKRDKTDEEDGNSPEYVVLRHWDGAKQEESTFRVLTLPRGLGGVPIAVPRGYSTDESIVNTSLDTLKLTLIDTVKPSAFDGSSGVRTKDGYYELAENIGVYVSEQNRFVSLQTAKSNYTSFRVYANKTAENGGKIRVIVAS